MLEEHVPPPPAETATETPAPLEAPEAREAPEAPAPDGASVAAAPPAAGEAPPPAAAPELSPAACAQQLIERFPALFAAVPPLPIKLRIQADIQARAPGVFTRKAMSLFLHRYTTTTAYLKALVAAPHRFDLDGAPAGEVLPEHREAAVAEIERRRAIVESRRAAERQARRPPRPAQAEGQPPPQGTAAEGAAPRGSERPPRRERVEGGEGSAGRGGRHGREGRERPPQQRPAQPQHQPRQPRLPDAHDRDDARPDHGAQAPPQPLALPNFVELAARRERAALLRAFESSPLTKANFCVLKRITEAELDAQLALARQDAAPPKR